MKRPIVILLAVVVVAVLVGTGAYALMRDSGEEESKPENVAAEKSPQPSSAFTLTPAAVEELLPPATTTPEPLPPGQEGGSSEGGAGTQPQPVRGTPIGSFAPYPRDPDWTPGPLPENLERRGNCVVLKGSVEVFPDAAVAAGGRVFDERDSANTRTYSLPDGRCISISGGMEPPSDWVPPNLLTPEPGYEKRGNCVVPEGAVEVSTDAATAAGGRIFDYAYIRYYSLPDGRCVRLATGKPFPDWVTPSIEQEYWPTPFPTKEGGMSQ